MSDAPDTLIELFDRRQDDNLAAAALLRPRRAVFLCPGDLPAAVREGISSFIRRESPSTGVLFFSADLDDPAKTAKKLEKVLQLSGGGVIDITGGGEAAAFAAGMVCAGNHVPVIAYDYEKRRLVSVRGAHFLSGVGGRVRMSVSDAFGIAGGSVDGYGRISPGEIESRLPDIDAVWAAFKAHDRAWQRFTVWVQAAVSLARQNGDITAIDAPRVFSRPSGGASGDAKTNLTILRRLRAGRIISRLSWTEDRVSFVFKDEKLASLLCDAGVWLELYCWAGALRSGVFDDCASSVLVSWKNGSSGREGGGGTVTHNEIDCVAVRWPAKLFISCKLSVPSAQALNEIKTLASRFGGAGGKAVLMTMGDASKDRFFSQRAADLHIEIIDRRTLASGDPGALEKRLSQIAGS